MEEQQAGLLEYIDFNGIMNEGFLLVLDSLKHVDWKVWVCFGIVLICSIVLRRNRRTKRA